MVAPNLHCISESEISFCEVPVDWVYISNDTNVDDNENINI